MESSFDDSASSTLYSVPEESDQPGFDGHVRFAPKDKFSDRSSFTTTSSISTKSSSKYRRISGDVQSFILAHCPIQAYLAARRRNNACPIQSYITAHCPIQQYMIERKRKRVRDAIRASISHPLDSETSNRVSNVGHKRSLSESQARPERPASQMSGANRMYSLQNDSQGNSAFLYVLIID